MIGNLSRDIQRRSLGFQEANCHYCESNDGNVTHTHTSCEEMCVCGDGEGERWRDGEGGGLNDSKQSQNASGSSF